MKLDQTVTAYILDAISNEGYYAAKELKTDKEKLSFLMDTFKSEYAWGIERYGMNKAFTEWIAGLPSGFNIDFENHKILELARAWGSIKTDATEAQEDTILMNRFNFITVKTFQLFRKHKLA